MAGTTNFYGISYPTSTDYVKDGATAMQTIATGFDSVVAIPTYNNQTGTSYTFVLADTGKTVTSNNASAVTFTIPPQSSVTWSDNTSLRVTNLGAGVLSIAGGAGVTVTNSAATVAQYSSATIVRTASNAWTVVPAGSPAGLTLISAQNLSAVGNIAFSNVFNSTYTHYRLVFSGIGSTTNYFTMRVRNNTTDYTGAQYRYAEWKATSGQTTGFTHASASGTSFGMSYFVGTSYETICSFDIIPNGLYLSYSGTGHLTTSNGETCITSGSVLSTSTINGINFITSSGTFTGSMSLYGYRK